MQEKFVRYISSSTLCHQVLTRALVLIKIRRPYTNPSLFGRRSHMIAAHGAPVIITGHDSPHVPYIRTSIVVSLSQTPLIFHLISISNPTILPKQLLLNAISLISQVPLKF